MRERLLSEAFSINKNAIKKIIPITIILTQLLICNIDDNKNKNTPLPNIRVKPIAKDTFLGNTLIFSNNSSHHLSYVYGRFC